MRKVHCILSNSAVLSNSTASLNITPDFFTFKTYSCLSNSPALRAVTLWFILIYKNMLKSIATASSECTTKQENKASYNTDYIVPDLIDFFGDDWKEIKTQIEKRNILYCKKNVLTKNWFVVNNFWEFPKDHTEKCFGHLYFLLKTKVKFATFRTFWLQST